MRTKWLVLASCILSVLMISGSIARAGGDFLAEAKDQGFFVLGLDDSFPPMGFREKGSQEIVGFDIDLAKEVGRRMGLEVKLRPVEWDGVVMSLMKGDIDVIWNGMTITEERKAKINFTKPYLNNRQIIIVNDDDIQSKDDLADKVVGIQMGSSADAALSSDAALLKSLKDVRKYENNTLALMDLKAGRVDAVVLDEIVGRYYISKDAGSSFKVLDEGLANEEYGVGVRKKNTAFLAELNKQLDAVKQSPEGDAISKKWFGANVWNR